jgi:hypothetical protein
LSVLLVIVAAGNHLILDAVAGAAVSAVGLAATWLSAIPEPTSVGLSKHRDSVKQQPSDETSR